MYDDHDYCPNCGKHSHKCYCSPEAGDDVCNGEDDK